LRVQNFNTSPMKKLYNLRSLFIAVILLSISNLTLAQLTVNGGGTPSQIINAFVSSGLTVSNVVLNCGVNAANAPYGTFDGTNSNLGIPGGVLLTTGQANLAGGANNINSAGYCRQSGPMIYDPQLTALEPTAIYDVCILEFDVIPHCDSLIINFAFASEEYPEYVDAGFNDVFGFFVTGPGSDCVPGFYNNTNVAQLPNGDIVSIDNINNGYASGCPAVLPGPCMNCTYYTNNCGGATIQYDGMTKPIYVSLGVCPCATYHWKFAIADANDCVYDSGIFLNYLTSCSTNFSYDVTTSADNCACDGSASVNVTSGLPPYTYSWAPGGQTTQSVSGLCAGTYTVYVTDASSCGFPTSEIVTIPYNSNLTATANSTSLTCYGSGNGSASVTPNGGSGPYTYLWSPGGQTGQTATSLQAGNYTVTVTEAGGCTTTQMVTVTQPAQLIGAAPNNGVSCYGACDAVLSVNSSGGTPPYTYTGQTSGLCAGTYTIMVTDANGCTANISAVVTEPPALTSNANILSSLDCNGDCDAIARVIAAGGTPSYSYSWNTTPVQTSATATNLCAGNYSVSVTDIRGCTSVAPITITEPSLLTASLSSTDASCSSCSDGIITITASGGTPTYSYTISPSAGTLSGNMFINVPPGDYYVCTIDSNNCVSCDSINVGFAVSIGVLSVNDRIYFYPNPFSGQSWFIIDMAMKSDIRLIITDAVGRSIKDIDILNNKTLITREDVPASGIYFYQLMDTEKTISKGKLIVVD
jgi:hypothetical protein